LRRPRRDWALVGAAGPAMNVLIAIGLTAILSLLVHLGLAGMDSVLSRVLVIGIFLNALLAIFNLIPIPPLDGSRVLQYFLSGEALIRYRRLEQFGLFIILALLLLVPGVSLLLFEIIFHFVELLTTPFGVWTVVGPQLNRIL
jgi:Zn-dependent protease